MMFEPSPMTGTSCCTRKNGLRTLRGTHVVNQNMRTGVSKRGCDGPPNSPGRTCHQRGLALKCSHHPQPSIRPSSLRSCITLDPTADPSVGGGIRDNRGDDAAIVQETVCLENKG